MELMATARHNRLNHKIEFQTWRSMISRCTNNNDHSYKNYGGRGISVCKRWLDSFEAFYADIGPKPSPELSIDRIDNEGNYELGNVRWATAKQQANNKRPGRVEHPIKIYVDPSPTKRPAVAKSQKLQAAAEIATALKVKASTVLRWHREGKIPSVRISRATIRFRLNDVLKALEKQEG